MFRQLLASVVLCGALTPAGLVSAQVYGPPDRDQPGDEMIQAYLARAADELDARFGEDLKSRADWETVRARYKEEYFYMLGLRPMPEPTPLRATVTGVYEGDGFVVEKLHYQSRPRLYVTANLYRPARVEPSRRLPAVLYVCGHSNQGRDGNKTAYQSHGIWLARHGYVCLVLDSLQLGEIAAIHHGTYREGRWWWHARGYTPAGVECLNGMRGVDYLQSREDVDPSRIAVTGISGGGAATFWIAAADERLVAAVPVSGMADLVSYVGNRVINGHCDCMFLYNTFQWPWTRIAALVAPRPMLFTNSDADAIFPMDANDRVICRLERLYSLYGASDRVDAMLSIGGHAYRQDIRQAAFRFLNTYLKNDPSPVEDSEVDLVVTEAGQKRYPIEPRRLRVFPEDADLPSDELNTTIDQHFVPMAEVEPPQPDAFDAWKSALVAELRRVAFGYYPERIAPAKPVDGGKTDCQRIETEPGIFVPLRRLARAEPLQSAEPTAPRRVLLLVAGHDAPDGAPAFLAEVEQPGDIVYELAPRGVGPTRWTTKNPPNYVERSHVLLGRTVAAGRIWDVVAAARWLHARHPEAPLVVAGHRGEALLAAYAGVIEPEIGAVVAVAPPRSHMDAAAPPLLNVLRVCDLPDVLGLIAPKRLDVLGVAPEQFEKTAAIYASAGARDQLSFRPADPASR